MLTTCVVSHREVALIGMPEEARLLLAQAVVAVATAPKSNATYLAIDRAITGYSRRARGRYRTLRDAHYAGAKTLGMATVHSTHDQPPRRSSTVPDDLEGAVLRPTESGHEAMHEEARCDSAIC